MRVSSLSLPLASVPTGAKDALLRSGCRVTRRPRMGAAQPLAGEIYFWHDAMGRITYREACLQDCSVVPNRPDFYYTYDLAGCPIRSGETYLTVISRLCGNCPTLGKLRSIA